MRRNAKDSLVEISAAVTASANTVNASFADRIRDTRASRATLEERLKQANTPLPADCNPRLRAGRRVPPLAALA